MAENNDDIFHIKLDQEGIGWILRISRLVGIIVLLSIMFSISGIIGGIIQLNMTAGLVYPGNKFLSFIYKIYPYWLFVYFLFFINQTYWYWKFNKAIKNAISNMSDQRFNASFSSLYNFSKTMIFILSLTNIANAMNLYMLLSI